MAVMSSHERTLSVVFGDKRWEISPRRVFLLLLVIGILIRIPLIFASHSEGFQYSSWRQSDTASIAHNLAEDDLNLFYPQINWRGNGPGYVETEFQLYPFLAAVLYKVFGEAVELGLFVSFLFSVGTMALFCALACRILEPVAAFFAFSFFVISPLFFRYSVVFMPEPTMLFFYIAALFLFNEWLSRQKLWLLWLAAASTAMAILIKPTAIHMGIIFLLLLFQQYGWQLVKKPQLWVFALISLVPGVLWYLHARDLYLTYGNTFGVLSGGDNKFDNLRYWTSPSFYESLLLIDLKWVFAVGGIVPFLIGFEVAAHQRRLWLIVYGTLTIILYYFLLPRYNSFAAYYHIFAVPFVALNVGLGYAWIVQRLMARKSLLARNVFVPVSMGALSLALILAVAAYSYARVLIPRSQPLYECASQVARLVPENSLIVVSTDSAAREHGITNNYQQPDIFFYSHRLGWSLPADWHTPAKLDEYHNQGGDYFIIYDESLYEGNSPLKTYLERHTRQIGPGVEEGCGIYRFVHHHSS